MIQTDIAKLVGEYDINSYPDSRYVSFDYCYNHFHTTDDLTKDIEKSCLVLGFYLASWGMFRGSSFILQKSVKHFQPTIQYIASLPRSVWGIDVDCYTTKNIQIILHTYSDVKRLLVPNGNKDLTLVTKILLGVFGFIPAFDDNFCKSFKNIFQEQCRFRVVNEKSLSCIKQFYDVNRQEIDKLSNEVFTIDFLTGEKTNINYPKAKIIDMYGWQKATVMR